jgi:ubiquinone/menaquinone biosynthesis C-methylase UbiE
MREDAMSTEQQVSQHYAHGALERAILDALDVSRKVSDRLDHTDLAPVDEFHIGGRQATADFTQQLKLRPDMHVLDVGSGLGGASRYVASEFGCKVSGIDLTDEYVRVADSLSRRIGLDDKVSYQQGSALSLPFPDRSFDAAYMIHVGMNIADKAGLAAEVRRVLKPGALFGIYDIMREGEGAFAYPVPWATTGETNFIEAASAYKAALEAAGFEVLKERSRREFAIEFFRQLRGRMAQAGPPALGLQIVMGATAPQKMANMIALVENGTISPTELIAKTA